METTAAKPFSFLSISLIDKLGEFKEGQYFCFGEKIYKIIGFDTLDSTRILCVRILKSTFKASRKQPLFEIFKRSGIKIG